MPKPQKKLILHIFVAYLIYTILGILGAFYFQEFIDTVLSDILILDEATSSLDNETENAVMEAIESLQGTITMIIISHRLSTIRNCNRIFEISEGRAIEVKKDRFM